MIRREVFSASIAWILCATFWMGCATSLLAADWSPFAKLPGQVPPPEVAHSEWQGSAIDRFVYAKLAEKGLAPSEEAGRSVWLRRVTFDLIGMPPTPAEVKAFLDDERDGRAAREAVVERLLASKHFGEHWGRQWLDVVRYADTDGFAIDDERPSLWRYRDYVIRVFNDDRPFDRFVREQVAGDEYEFGPEGVVASSFLRLGPYERDNMTPENRRQDFLNEMTTAVSNAFLGLTVGCARCHDHKYDPISQADFYRLQAFLQPYERKPPQPAEFLDKELTSFVRQKKEAAEAELAKRKDAEKSHTDSLRSELAAALGVKPDEVKDELFAKALKGEAIELPNAEHPAMPEEAAPANENEPAGSNDSPKRERGSDENDAGKTKDANEGKDADKSETDNQDKKEPTKPRTFTLAKEKRDKLEALKTAVKDYQPTKQFASVADIVVAKEKFEDVAATHVLGNGDPFAKQDAVEPGCLSSVPAWSDELADRIEACAKLSSGRRRVLADWLSSPQNPLTPRVYVNRIWQHHFGTGIVATSNDFGENGSGPSHPQLLDHLARHFIDHGWRTKPLIRMIVLSRAYRSSARHEHWEECAKADPDNRLLWRAPMRRLRAEAIRDSLLAVSGELNPAAGGPGFFDVLPDGMATKLPFFSWTASKPEERNRRSNLYVPRRNLVHPMMEAFDVADSSQSCERRGESVTAAQSLAMFNGKFVKRASVALAKRLADEQAEDKARIRRLFMLAFGRPATEDDTKDCLEFLRGKQSRYADAADAADAKAGEASKNADAEALSPELQALRDLCMVMLCSNEFMYLD